MSCLLCTACVFTLNLLFLLCSALYPLFPCILRFGRSRFMHYNHREGGLSGLQSSAANPRATITVHTSMALIESRARRPCFALPASSLPPAPVACATLFSPSYPHPRSQLAVSKPRPISPVAGAILRCRPANVISDKHIDLLLQHCCLTRHTGHLAAAGHSTPAAAAGGECFVFALPGAGAGAAIRSVDLGRREIMSMLARKRHPEVLEAALAKKGLKKSVLGARWHVRELVGSGALLRLDTTAGPLLRVPAKRR